MNSNPLKTLSKSGGDLVVGNYIVLFGGKDLVGEYFTKNTVFDSPYTDIGTLYVDFEHGLDPDKLGIDHNSVLGVVDWKSAKTDEKGIFVERVLNRRAKYVDFLVELLKEGVIGTSSESIRSQIGKKSDGEITHWPLKRDSLTFTPMEPRMITSNVLGAAKSLAEFFPQNKALANLLGRPVPDEIRSVERIETIRDAEAFLRDVGGLSKSHAAAFIGRFKSLIATRDAGSAGLAELAESLNRRGQAIRR